MYRTIPAAFVVGLLLGTATAAHGQAVSGCIRPNGTIVKAKIGSTPAAACTGKERRFTTGARGAPGAPGPRGPAGPAGPPGADAEQVTIPFFVELADQEEATIANAGPLELFARCELDVLRLPPPEFGPQIRADVVSLHATSTVDDWVLSFGGPPRLAGEEVLVVDSGDNIRVGQPRLVGPGRVPSSNLVLDPAVGAFIAIQSVAFGANLTDAGGCVVAGTVAVHEGVAE